MAILIPPISIEPMRERDLEAVAAIDRRVYTTPWYYSAYVTELSNRSAVYLVAREGERIVGYAGQWIVMDEAHITTLAVDPARQGRKIGERLLIALIEEALYRRAKHIKLEVRENNRIAQNLYRKYGFQPMAMRKHYYVDTGESAVVMWASDIHHHQYRALLDEHRRTIEQYYQQEERF
ncbi:ribosomal-protein-alanine acetyltransferase [Armatimonadota bacterium]|nr:ribosomal-protein-alanine acetyltransferase [Armatimonadota bacterium]